MINGQNMRIIINGKEQIINTGSLTIRELLRISDVKSPDMVSVQLNRKFVNRDDFDTTLVSESDEIDFLYFMGGGNLF
jgi:sulfur carrier protein